MPGSDRQRFLRHGGGSNHANTRCASGGGAPSRTVRRIPRPATQTDESGATTEVRDPAADLAQIGMFGVCLWCRVRAAQVRYSEPPARRGPGRALITGIDTRAGLSDAADGCRLRAVLPAELPDLNYRYGSITV